MSNRDDKPLPTQSQSSAQSDDDDDDDDDNEKQESHVPHINTRLSVEQGETRHVTIPEAVGLHFNSFIPQADITSQVHFISNIQANSIADTAGLKDGDRILQVNGVNVTNLEHEDVRKLMQLMTPIVFTVANDAKYLSLLQQPVQDVEEKQPEPPIIPTSENGAESIHIRTKRPSIDSLTSSLASISSKANRYQLFNITKTDESTIDEHQIPIQAKLCRLRRSKNYDGYGLILKFQQHLHIIGEVEHASPSYRAGLRENDVIIFVGTSNVEKLTHDDVKVMIRAMTLASNKVDLTVLSKADIPKYKTLQQKSLIDWSVMGLEK